MAEFIGSRISLISKSEIRGTEGRLGNPDQELPGSDQVYEGIVFRGSDVKDLSILAPPGEVKQPQMPNDPAILGSSQPQSQHQPPPPPPPQQQQPPPNQYRGPPGPPYQQQNQFGYQGPPPGQFQQQPRFQGPGGAHGFPGSPGAVPGYGMGYGGPPPPGYGMGMGYGPPPGQGFPPHPHAPFSPQHQMPIGTPGAHPNQQRPPPPSQQPQQSVSGKQTTPQPPANQAPVPPSQPAPAEKSTAPVSSAPATSAPPPPLESKPPTSAATAPTVSSQAPTAIAAKAAQRANNRVAVPLPAPNAGVNQPRPKAAPIPQVPSVTAAPLPQVPADATDAATAAVAAAMARLAVNAPAAGGMDNLTQKVHHLRAQDAHTRGRGRGGRGGGAPRGGRRDGVPKTVEVPKEDFDFESANAKFNKHELAKEAIASGSPVPRANGADASDSISSPPDSMAAVAAATADTNGHATVDESDDVVIPDKPVAERGYDKKSSFFDNISSDLKDRAEPRGSSGGEFFDGRSMRREERSKNVETFGQGSVDSGYRGRGRGRGRGFGRGRGYFGGRGAGAGTGPGPRGRGRGGAEVAL